MSFREADPSIYGAEYFSETRDILEIGVGSDTLTAVTPVIDPEKYVITDVLPSNATYAADLTDHPLLYWGRRGPDPRIVRVHADGVHLPFRDQSFDAVFAANVIGDLSISAYDKADMIAESLRVIRSCQMSVGAHALWLIENNTPEFAANFMRSWSASSHSDGCSVEKAVISAVDVRSSEQFNPRNYPLTVGYGGECTIYKIAAADHDTSTS